MKGDKIYYREGYKYQLTREYRVFIGIFVSQRIETEWLTLDTDGWLTIREGYAWDGPSGPTFDTPSSMRGSLIHDALYQLIRRGLLESGWRDKADDLLHDTCIEDGMIHFRAELWEEAVSHFAETAADPASEPEEIEAP